MKHLYTILIVLFSATTASAQSSEPFYIGIHGFSPEYSEATHNTHYVRGVRENPIGANRYEYLDTTQFRLARELGANLISSFMHRDYVVTGPAADNVVHEISDSAASAFSDTLRLCMYDFGIDDFMSGDRIILNPESYLDFDTCGLFEPEYSQQFNNLPFESSNLSSPLTTPSADDNAVRLEPGANLGEISGVTWDRKYDLSMYRDWWEFIDQTDSAASGLYIVSVIVQADEPEALDESETNLMNLEIKSLDTAQPGPSRVVTFHLRESDFFDAAHEAYEGPVEIAIGRIEIRQALDPLGNRGIVYISNPDSTGNTPSTAWEDTTLFTFTKILESDEYHYHDSTVHAKFDSIDIRITYGEGDVTFLLDAVCLTSPRAYAIFNEDSPIFASGHPWGLDVWEDTRAGFETRIDAIVNDQGRAGDRFPSLRLIGGPEQIVRSAQWPMTSVTQRMLETRDDKNLWIYCASGYTEATQTATAFNRRFASGYYGYPIKFSYPRPAVTTDTSLYYQSLNSDPNGGLTSIGKDFLAFAEQRKQLGAVYPWIPFVQNHCNAFFSENPHWDSDTLREPTAAELRAVCNIPLAFGADGIMYYTFISIPYAEADPAWWPSDLATFNLDPNRPLDRDAGELGFIDENLVPRRGDWNGESKWDSARTFIHDFLQPIGDFIKQHLAWQEAKIWYVSEGAGASALVSKVLSMRQDIPAGIDESAQTYVITSEFEHDDTGNDYLFVLNARTHPVEGHRHITVKLGEDGEGGADNQLKVTKVLGENHDGDIWIVKPDDNPDSTTTANGFTDYFEPGAAALYRIEAFDDDTVGQSGVCYHNNITITPGATVALNNTSLSITNTASITVEDSLYMFNTILTCCEAESAANLYVRDGGGVLANQSEIGNVKISVGPQSSVKLLGTAITPLAWTDAIYVADGYVTTYRNEVDLTSGGTFIYSYGNSEMYLRADSVFGNYVDYASGVDAHGGCCYVEGLVLKGLGFGLSALNNSYIGGCDISNPVLGENKIWTDMVCLYAAGGSEVNLGEAPWGNKSGLYGSHNSLGILSSGYHASNSGGTIYARENFFGTGAGPVLTPSAPLIYGSVDTSRALQTDPVPFAGLDTENDKIDDGGDTGSTLARTTNTIPSFAFSTTGQLRSTVNQLLSLNQKSTARTAISAFFSNINGVNVSAIPAEDLHYIYRTLNIVDGRNMLGDLTALCVAHPNMRTKLLLADILEREGSIDGALTVLNSYSFIGSSELYRDALIRKAILYPLSGQGGYNDGLAVLDTLAQLAVNDTTLNRFIEKYPILFSRLTHSPDTNVTSKKYTQEIMAVAPEGFTIDQNYPNPFRDVTSFTFKLGEATHVRLLVYDAMGRQVASVTDADYNRGIHSVVLRSAHLPSGLYFYRFVTDSGIIQRKMMLVR